MTSRAFDRSRTAIRRISSFTPSAVRSEIRFPLRSRIFQTPEPTVPNPATPIPMLSQPALTGQPITDRGWSAKTQSSKCELRTPAPRLFPITSGSLGSRPGPFHPPTRATLPPLSYHEWMPPGPARTPSPVRTNQAPARISHLVKASQGPSAEAISKGFYEIRRLSGQ